MRNEIEFNNLEPKFIETDLIKRIESFDLINKRKEIFLEKHKVFGNRNLLNIDLDSISPFCYPLLVKNEDEADKIVLELINNGYNIFRYWEELPSKYPESKFYERLIPIPLEN